jgi:phospholipase C
MAGPSGESRNDTVANLSKIDQVVVLMLEKRSFDHMLGYLSLARADGGGGRPELDGLDPGMANEWAGRSFPVHQLTRTAFAAVDDPDHSGAATTVQIAGGAMTGFVESFSAVLAERGAADRDSGLVMGY